MGLLIDPCSRSSQRVSFGFNCSTCNAVILAERSTAGAIWALYFWVQSTCRDTQGWLQLWNFSIPRVQFTCGYCGCHHFLISRVCCSNLSLSLFLYVYFLIMQKYAKVISQLSHETPKQHCSSEGMNPLPILCAKC